MIIPGGEDGDRLGQGSEVRLAEKIVVLLFENGHVFSVSVDVVTHEEEDVRLFGEDGLEDPLVTFGLVAGTTGDAGDRFGRRKKGGQEREDKDVNAGGHNLAIAQTWRKARSVWWPVVASCWSGR